MNNNNNCSQVPPGFRFHPTDEELVDYYLRNKITSPGFDLDVIKDVDLYKIEPWDLQEVCGMGIEEQKEWYFFSYKDKKYPTGTRTNRATTAGFWKATGRDKPIYSKHDLIGMRKTLVFYQGRAPNGQKSDWIMHEYRLEHDANGTSQEEGWVVCRVFKKKIASTQRATEHDSPHWYDDNPSLMADMDSPYHLYTSPFLPPLETLKMGGSSSSGSMSIAPTGLQQPSDQDQVTTDWRVLDKFVASQLIMTQEDTCEDSSLQTGKDQEMTSSSSSCQIDHHIWK